MVQLAGVAPGQAAGSIRQADPREHRPAEEREPVAKRVADRIKQIRQERGWSARELAEKCETAGDVSLTRSTIAKIESGVRKSVTADEIDVLARVLGVTPTDLLASEKTAAASEPIWEPQGELVGRRGYHPVLPVHRSIIAIDIEQSAQRPSPVKALLRQELYSLLMKALHIAGIGERYRDPLVDRGDGVLVLIRPTDDIPKPVLISRLIPALSALLYQYNDGVRPSESPSDRSRKLRLRAVIHAGEVHYDSNGCFGEPLDVAFRLLDSRSLKAQLRNDVAPLAFIVSDDIYWSILRYGYDGIDSDEFRPLVRVNVAGRRQRGWVHLPEPAHKLIGLPKSASGAFSA